MAIFLICLGATGSPWASSLILLTLAMLLVDLMGVMVLAGIQLNAGGRGTEGRGRRAGDAKQGRLLRVGCRPSAWGPPTHLSNPHLCLSLNHLPTH